MINYLLAGANIGIDNSDQNLALAKQNALNIIEEYKEVSDFWNEQTNSFDPDKYADFLGLFDDDGLHFNDLKKGETCLKYYEYAEQIFESVKDEGVHFDIESFEMASCELDSLGFYQITVSVRKRVFTQINYKNQVVLLKKGRRLNLNFQIEIPLYDLKKPLITSVEVNKENLLIKGIRILNRMFK